MNQLSDVFGHKQSYSAGDLACEFGSWFCCEQYFSSSQIVPLMWVETLEVMQVLHICHFDETDEHGY